MTRMFYITVWQKYMADFDKEETLQNLMDLADSPAMLAELIDLIRYRFDQIDLVDERGISGSTARWTSTVRIRRGRY